MDIQIDSDLVISVERGELDEWQAMTVQTCRDAAYARSAVDELQKKMDDLSESDPLPSPEKTSVVRLVSRGG